MVDYMNIHIMLSLSQQHQNMLGSPHGGGANVLNRYHLSQNNPAPGEVSFVGIPSSMNPHAPASSIGPGLLARFVSPSAIASSQASDIANSNSKSLPNIPTAIGRHMSGSKVRRFSDEIWTQKFLKFNSKAILNGDTKMIRTLKSPYINRLVEDPLRPRIRRRQTVLDRLHIILLC